MGLDRGAFAQRVRDGSLRHVGLGESLHFLAHYLGLCIEQWSESIEPVLAERRHESGLGPVLPGQVRGVRQVAHGLGSGEKLLELSRIEAGGRLVGVLEGGYALGALGGLARAFVEGMSGSGA